MSRDIYYTLSGSESQSIQSDMNLTYTSLPIPPPHSTPRYNKNKINVCNDKTKENSKSQSVVVRGYATLCWISSLLALFSILLIHAMSSIWLDPARNPKTKSELVYITVALATASASLNFYSLGVFGIQIYLVYTESLHDEKKLIVYLKEVSTVRFIASFSVLLSIPIFMTSFSCYLYMEFRHTAATIAISIFAFGSVSTVAAVSFSYLKWNRTVSNFQKPRNKEFDNQDRMAEASLTFQNTRISVENDQIARDHCKQENKTSHSVQIKNSCFKKSKKANTKVNSTAEASRNEPLPTLPELRPNASSRVILDSNNLQELPQSANNLRPAPIPASRKLKPSFSESLESDDVNCSSSTLV